jgi:DNA-binding MarR family transcriptional regulator
VAIFGTIFAGQLHTNLDRLISSAGLPAGFDPNELQANPAALLQLPPVIHTELIRAYADSIHVVFLIAAPIALVGFVLTWFLQELPLRQTARATDPGETFGMPETRSSLDELARALSVLTSREGRRRMYERLAARAGVDLSPGEVWLVLRTSEQSEPSLAEIARRASANVETLHPFLNELQAKGLAFGDTSPDAPIRLTPAGEATMDQLLAARREGLAELLAGWSPEHHTELAEMLSHLARSFSSDERSAKAVA